MDDAASLTPEAILARLDKEQRHDWLQHYGQLAVTRILAQLNKE